MSEARPEALTEDATAEDRLAALRASLRALGHELNNAVAPISGFSELLLETDAGQDPAKVRRYAELIHGSAQEMLRLVAALRELTTISPAPLPLGEAGRSPPQADKDG